MVALHCRVASPTCPRYISNTHMPLLHSQVNGPENWVQGASFTRHGLLVLSPKKYAGRGEYAGVFTPLKQARPQGRMWFPSSLSVNWLWFELLILLGWRGCQHWMHIKGLWIEKAGPPFFLTPFTFALASFHFHLTCVVDQVSSPFLTSLLLSIQWISFIARKCLQILSTVSGDNNSNLFLNLPFVAVLHRATSAMLAPFSPSSLFHNWMWYVGSLHKL